MRLRRTRVRRVAPPVLTVLALAAAVVVSGAPGSRADEPRLLVATTAQGPFRAQLSAPLFEDVGLLSPRDVASAGFWVRNGSQEAVRTTVAVVRRGPDSDLARALTFDVDVSGTRSSGSVPSPEDPQCQLVTTGPSLRPDEVQQVAVDLEVADLPAQVATAQAAAFDVVVTLTPVGGNGEVEVCGEQAQAHPETEVAGEQATGEQAPPGAPASCGRDVVVTTVGRPTCVPVAVAAGSAPGEAAYGAARPATGVAGTAVLLVAAGAVLLLWSTRRRHPHD